MINIDLTKLHSDYLWMKFKINNTLLDRAHKENNGIRICELIDENILLSQEIRKRWH